MTPRTQIASALQRKEASYTGIYLLIGEQDGQPLAYVGEGEDISERIRSHDSRKDWWSSCVLVTSAANNLNKAHVRYLEARLVEEIRLIGRIALENGSTPGRPSLSEPDQAKMEAFLDYLGVVLPAIRVDFLLRNTRPNSAASEDPANDSAATFELTTPRHGIHAYARVEDGEFIVQAGSTARNTWVGKGTEETSYAQLHRELVQTGIIAERDGKWAFTQNYAFKSPSAAAAVVNGRPANGTTEWKLCGAGMSYKDWERSQLESHALGRGLEQS